MPPSSLQGTGEPPPTTEGCQPGTSTAEGLRNLRGAKSLRSSERPLQARPSSKADLDL